MKSLTASNNNRSTKLTTADILAMSGVPLRTNDASKDNGCGAPKEPKAVLAEVKIEMPRL